MAEGTEAPAGGRVTVWGSPPCRRRLKGDSGLEINVEYFENVSGAVLRPHMTDY